jgi:acyl-coenzyme A synthetase/AMP-(fatty) acid ligase/acyl carrier protein
VPREHADVDDGEVTFVQDPDAISHVIYTSGSTGRPKAAPSPHRQILNRLHWMWRDYPFEKGEVGCVKTATSFIDSLWELLGPLLQAVPSVMVPQQGLMDPERTIRLLAQHEVSRLWLVPSYLRALLDAAPDIGARLPRLRFWVASGEILPIELQRRFSVAHPAATLFNLYGTSEVWDATWHDPRLFNAEGATRVPIGRPIDNVLCVVLDPWGRLAPAGVTGELHVGGIAMGCSRQSARRRCIEVANHDSLEVWSCGDMVRWRHDGELEFIGRSDGELKIRGMRVEPAELESVLMEHSAVRSAALLAWPAPGGTLRLVAYVQPRDRLPAAAELRAFIAERVPGFMVPEQFVFLESVPSTGSGKVDREKLRQDGDPIERLQQHVAQVPRSETERAVASIWSELLGREPAAEDNFFAMGGHSLMAAQVVARIQMRLGVRLELRQMFERPTVASLACAIEEMRSSHVPTPQAIPRVERQFVRPR